MIFNSIEYLFFLPIVFVLYWFVFKKGLKPQNLLILISSYVFYGWWDWRFLSLIFLSTIVDYVIGLKIHQSESIKTRKVFLWGSIIFNLSVLGFFKYFNFFIESWVDLLSSVGYQVQSTWTLKIILPVGISFYTFQTMSYSLDIFRKKLNPTKDFISFASFVSFFPQLVAGPIERASNLLPQILNKREFKYQQGVQGLKLIAWGMFKKVVIADSLAPIVDDIFLNYHHLDGGTLALGAICFAFQIYGDFSGYSDIAIGTAKLFGIELKSNFKFPYLSRDIAEFWRRWHISLSTWFRDYLYIPLGGSRKGKWLSLRNIFVIFLVSGFWHGANWTFIIWGGIHAMMYVPLFIAGTNRKHTNDVAAQNRWFPKIKEIVQIGITFFFVTIAWVFFRSESVTDSVNFIVRIFSDFEILGINNSGLYYCLVLFSIDWFLRRDERMEKKFKSNLLENLFYLIIVAFVIAYFDNNLSEFIYFQF